MFHIFVKRKTEKTHTESANRYVGTDTEETERNSTAARQSQASEERQRDRETESMREEGTSKKSDVDPCEVDPISSILIVGRTSELSRSVTSASEPVSMSLYTLHITS